MPSQVKPPPRDNAAFKVSFYHIFVLIIIFSFALPVLFVLYATRSSSVSKIIESKSQSLDSSMTSHHSSAVVQANQQRPSSRLRRYAFAITITKDGFFQDGAAVLAYSIVRMFDDNINAKFSFIAFVHPSVNASRAVLKRLGYHVIVAPTPVNVSAIAGPILRDKIDKNGCCGASELIKLNSYRYVENCA